MASLILNVGTRGQWIVGFTYGRLIHRRKGSGDHDGHKAYQEALVDKFPPPAGIEPWFIGRPPLAYTLQSLSYNGFHSHSVQKLVGRIITRSPLHFPVTSQRCSSPCSSSSLQLSPQYGWKSLKVFSTWGCRVLAGEWWTAKDGKEVEWPNLDSVLEFAYGEWGNSWNNFVTKFGLSHDQNRILGQCKARILGVGV